MLDGKVAYVTGSTRGIGWATARLLAQRGASVIVHGNADRHQLEERVDQLRAEGATASGVLADVADPAAIAAAHRQILSEHKRLDVLVNNAGILDDALLGMIGTEAAAKVFDVNALGVLHNMQGASRLMARSGGGSIVNVSSIIGVVGNTGQVAYGGSKAAVIGMTRSAAKELAPKQIRVNAVAPGFIDTDMAHQLPPELYAERVASVKMGRVGTPEDVANVILFLASDLSAYVTGQVIGVDGGMLI